MPPFNRTWLALSIWWKREVLAGFRQQKDNIVTLLTLAVAIGFPILVGIALFPLGHAMDAYGACVTGHPLPVIVGQDWAARLERFAYAHMAAVNLMGMGLALWTVWSFADILTKSSGKTCPPPVSRLLHLWHVILFVVPLGLSFPWIAPAILIYIGAHLPRVTVLGVFHTVRWMWTLPGRWRDRCTQLIEDNPDMAIPAARRELDGQLPMAGSRINPVRRL